ncbi:PAS domain S-box protein [Pedobacter sp. GR22-6]|uniref:PAS domain S-box protein n=1 Tax=Pedobacter sp. GR22-6 TaxID=3127957 RepID=UPI00307EDE5F
MDDIEQANQIISVQDELNSAYRMAEERSAVLSAIIDSSDDAIISKNLDGIVTSWNLSAERIFGYTASEMIGTSILRLIPEDRADEEPHILSRLRNGDRVDHFHTKRRRKDGQLVDVSLTISPVRNREGLIIGVSKIARDITAIKIAEEKSAILSAIITSSDDAIISKDLNSTITSWNASAQRIFGYSAEEMIGESILKLIPLDRHQEEPLILGKLKSGERVEHFETRRMTKWGTLIDVSLTISPIKDNAGNIIGLSKIARDITDKKLEEQRKNDFISIVSHELKTPLTSLRSYIQLALIKARERTDEFSTRLLTRAEVQTGKMSTMIHDFLNLSRLEEGKMTLSLSKFSLADLMKEVVLEAEILASSHQLVMDACPEVELLADRDKLGQVLTNLLSNAVKYSASGSRITIDCLVRDNQVEISFADQGLGIAEEDQRHLFERFYRVRQDQQQSHVSGFGIGLYLVSEILKLHGSEIRLQSRPGEGSVFSFSLALES